MADQPVSENGSANDRRTAPAPAEDPLIELARMVQNNQPANRARAKVDIPPALSPKDSAPAADIPNAEIDKNQNKKPIASDITDQIMAGLEEDLRASIAGEKLNLADTQSQGEKEEIHQTSPTPHPETGTPAFPRAWTTGTDPNIGPDRTETFVSSPFPIPTRHANIDSANRENGGANSDVGQPNPLPDSSSQLGDAADALDEHQLRLRRERPVAPPPPEDTSRSFFTSRRSRVVLLVIALFMLSGAGVFWFLSSSQDNVALQPPTIIIAENGPFKVYPTDEREKTVTEESEIYKDRQLQLESDQNSNLNIDGFQGNSAENSQATTLTDDLGSASRYVDPVIVDRQGQPVDLNAADRNQDDIADLTARSDQELNGAGGPAPSDSFSASSTIDRRVEVINIQSAVTADSQQGQLEQGQSENITSNDSPSLSVFDNNLPAVAEQQEETATQPAPTIVAVASEPQTSSTNEAGDFSTFFQPLRRPFPISVAANSEASSSQALQSNIAGVDPSAIYVQLTARRSFGLAESALQSIKRRHSQFFENRDAVIRQVNIDGQGVFHRVLLAFGDRPSAVKWCTALRSDGGECFVRSD